jgi:hypothetical protein
VGKNNSSMSAHHLCIWILLEYCPSWVCHCHTLLLMFSEGYISSSILTWWTVA